MSSSASDSEPRSLASGRRFRLLKVYLTLFRVLGSFAGLRLLSFFRTSEKQELAAAQAYRRAARRVRETILDVQGLFIKVGQLISILTNFLPADFRDELQGLQDQIPPRPLAEIADRLERELGSRPQELFAAFDPEPIASASLAQVHAARLHDGRRVAVKVQHLDIEELAQLDLRTIRNLLRIVQVVMRIRGLTTAFQEVREMILDELDFAKEADHIEVIADNFAADPMVSCPEVLRERSTHRVLTTTFIEGNKITDLEALTDHGIDPLEVAERVVRAYCQMIFIDGLYHADPHPGNLLIRPDGGLVFLDFGAVSRLSPALKDGLPKFMEAVLRRDKAGILRTLRHMGFVARHAGQDTAERVIDYFYARFLDQLELDSWNLKDLRVDTQMKLEFIADMSRLDISIGELTKIFQVPKEWVLLQRTLVLLMGVSTHLHPEMRPMALLRPYLEEWVLGTDRDWMGFATRALKDVALSAVTIPTDFKSLLTQARRGEARLEIAGVREGASLLYALGHQLLYGIFAIATGAIAYLADGRGDDSLARLLAGVSGFFVVCLSGSMLRARRWQKELRRRPIKR